MFYLYYKIRSVLCWINKIKKIFYISIANIILFIILNKRRFVLNEKKLKRFLCLILKITYMCCFLYFFSGCDPFSGFKRNQVPEDNNLICNPPAKSTVDNVKSSVKSTVDNVCKDIDPTFYVKKVLDKDNNLIYEPPTKSTIDDVCEYMKKSHPDMKFCLIDNNDNNLKTNLYLNNVYKLDIENKEYKSLPLVLEISEKSLTISRINGKVKGVCTGCIFDSSFQPIAKIKLEIQKHDKYPDEYSHKIIILNNNGEIIETISHDLVFSADKYRIVSDLTSYSVVVDDGYVHSILQLISFVYLKNQDGKIYYLKYKTDLTQHIFSR